jgi:hypothetical protein
MYPKIINNIPGDQDTGEIIRPPDTNTGKKNSKNKKDFRLLFE